jgi:hypothetical protein
LVVLPAESREILPSHWLVKILIRLSNSRLSSTRLSKWFADLEFWIHDRLPLHRRLPAPSGEPGCTVVLTLAFFHGWMVAEKYALHYGLPLMVRFDDWWPDIVDVHPWLKRKIEERYKTLHDVARVSLCISEGMKSALDGQAKSIVILPIPEDGRKPAVDRVSGKPFRICYLGNLYDYGPMLGRLAISLEGQDDLIAEFRGGEPSWPGDLKERMRSRGLLHGFLEGPAFKDWFEGFDAYLVAMFFESEQRRRVETCFATKLLDYSSLGRPVIIWAPETSAVVRWARRSGAAVCVTDPNPEAVIAAARELAGDQQMCRDYGQRIRHAYESEFSHTELQKKFMWALETALDPCKEACSCPS